LFNAKFTLAVLSVSSLTRKELNMLASPYLYVSRLIGLFLVLSITASMQVLMAQTSREEFKVIAAALNSTEVRQCLNSAVEPGYEIKPQVTVLTSCFAGGFLHRVDFFKVPICRALPNRPCPRPRAVLVASVELGCNNEVTKVTCYVDQKPSPVAISVSTDKPEYWENHMPGPDPKPTLGPEIKIYAAVKPVVAGQPVTLTFVDYNIWDIQIINPDGEVVWTNPKLEAPAPEDGIKRMIGVDGSKVEFRARLKFGSKPGTYTVKAKLLVKGDVPADVTTTFNYGWAY
jgi:hypothetical protein